MTFLPIKDFEGYYEINQQGVIRSVGRVVIAKDGAKYPFKGKTLKLTVHKDLGYLTIRLWKNNKGYTFYVHRLVAQTHIPNPLNLPEVNHINGNRQDNAISNLEWVTSKENSQHAIRTGLISHTYRISDEEFVECLHAVLGGESYASLTTRVPYKVPFLSVKIRRLARELGLENELDESLAEQRRERLRLRNARHKSEN